MLQHIEVAVKGRDGIRLIHRHDRGRRPGYPVKRRRPATRSYSALANGPGAMVLLSADPRSRLRMSSTLKSVEPRNCVKFVSHCQ